MRRPLLLILACLASACTSEDNPPEAATSDLYTQPPDFSDSREPSTYQPPDTYDPNCHWDCFGETTCVDGVVVEYSSTPVPCDRWSGSCKSTFILQCQEGCRDGIFHFESNLSAGQEHLFCKENTPTIGSPCTEDIECFLVENRDTMIPPVINHLRCDTANGQCASILPTPSADYLQPCGLPETQTTESFVEAPACEGGVCIVHYDDDASLSACERSLQGCTQLCLSDLECPLGSLCVSAGQLAGDERSVCKPGALSQRSNLGLANACE